MRQLSNANKTEFCGLAIDDDQQFVLTDARVSRWVEQIIGEYPLQGAA